MVIVLRAFEQAGGLKYYASEKTNRMLWAGEVPASWSQP